MSKIIVKAHPETGAVVTPSTNNPEWGTVRLDSKETVVNNGIINVSVRSAFVRAKLEVLQSLNLKAEQPFPLPGKLVVKESFEPFYDGQPAKLNPSTGEQVSVNGKPVYRNVVFSQNMEENDEVIATQQATATSAARGLEIRTRSI